MKQAIVFGATESAGTLYDSISEEYRIVAFCDNDEKKQGKKKLRELDVLSPTHLMESDISYDEIIIVSSSSMEIIKKQLLEMGISHDRINTRFIEGTVNARIRFLHDFSSICAAFELEGAVAEAGVFQGEFAKEINKHFPDRVIYLFDTFCGFDKRDVEIEKENCFSTSEVGDLSITSEQMVIDKMPYPERCIIKKGYFPETTEGVDDLFCFVNLDMDLYKPTLEGLKWFWPRMVSGGIITVHDYFSKGYEGIDKAVKDFLESQTAEHIIPFPIGDGDSLAFQKA